MATADEYAAWIVKNADKKGTPDFETVAQAYRAAKGEPGAPKGTGSDALDAGNAIGTGYQRSMLGLAGLPADTAANVVDLGKAGIGSAYTAATGKVAPEWLQLGDRSNTPLTSAWLMKQARKTDLGKTLLDPANPEYEGGYLQSAGSGLSAVMNPSSNGQLVNQAVVGPLSQLLAKFTGDTTGNQALAIAAGTAPAGAQRAVTDGVKRVVRGGEDGRKAMEQRVQDLKNAGIDNPTLGLASGNQGIGALENLLQNAPGAVSRMRKNRDAALEGLANKTEQAADLASTNRGSTATGQGIQAGLNQSFKDKVKTKQGELYDTLETKIGSQTPTNVDKTQGTLARLNEDIQGSPSLSRFFKNSTIQALEKAMSEDVGQSKAYTPSQLRAALETNPQRAGDLSQALGEGALPFEAVKKTRTLVGNEIADHSLLSNVPKSKWKPLYASLSDDMQAAATKAGPEASGAFNRANDYTRASIGRMERVAPFADRAAPEQSFTALANTLGENVSTFQAVKKSLPEGVRGQMAGTVLERLGKARNGAQNDSGDVWSPETFLTNWNKMSPRARDELFSGFPNSGQVKADVEAVAKATSYMRDNSKMWANPSGTGANLAARGTLGGIGLGTVGALAGVVPWAVPALGGAAMLSSNLAARGLTSRSVVDAMTRGQGDPSSLTQTQIRALVSLLEQQKQGQTNAGN